MSDEEKHEGYIVEFSVSGLFMKATAFDPSTLKEVSVMGPRKSSRKHMGDLAVRKLEYMLGKDKS